MEWLIPVIITFFLIFLNAIFVTAEFALIGVPRVAIERRAAAGEQSAVLVQATLQDPRLQDRYIATTQLGISLASLALGMYGEHILAQWLSGLLEDLDHWIAIHTVASILAVAILTYFHIVLGEMVPKSLALMHAESAALWIIRPMRWIKLAVYPLAIGLNGLGNMFLRMVGVERQLTAGHYHTAEELQLIVEESEESGTLNAEAGQLLREMLELRERTAEEVMVPRVHVTGIPLGAKPDELGALINRDLHTRYPVFDGRLDKIVGFIHIKDVLRLLAANHSLQSEHVRPLSFVPETAAVDTILAALRRAHTHMVVVIDEYGGTAGIVSIEDLCDEVVGDIDEEPGTLGAAFIDAQGVLHVPGAWRLDEVSERLDRKLVYEGIDTIGGLVLHLLGREPVVGDTVTYEDVRITVVALEGYGVKWCVVAPEAGLKPQSTLDQA